MTETAVKYDVDADGIVTLTLDDPNSSANTMNDLYKESMKAAIDRLYAEKDQITGVVITSAKKTFFAGGNLKNMLAASRDDAEGVFLMGEQIKADLRRLELLGKPVVAAINGAALGGGLEITLACHHRIAVDDNKIDLGLPEVTLGLLPGGGGVTRTVRMLGLQSALMDVLLQGPRFKPAKAKEKGLIDDLVATQDELVPAARSGSWKTRTTKRQPRSRGIARATRCPVVRRPARRWLASCLPSRRSCASRSRALTIRLPRRSCPQPSRVP